MFVIDRGYFIYKFLSSKKFREIRSYDVFFFFSLSRQTSPLSFNFISSFGIHSCLFFPDFLLRFSPPLCDRSRGGKSESDENYDLKFKQKDGISRYLLTRD